MKILKPLRVFLAIVSFIAVTLLFIDVTGYAAKHWAFMAKIQLVPALLSLNFIVIVGLILLTLFFGRVYCSVICPLGIYQDVVNRVHTWFVRGKKRKLGRFRYTEGYKKTRKVFLAVFLVLIAVGFVSGFSTWLASLIEPYGAFGRIATQLLRPLSVSVNNSLADAAAANDSYAFATVAAQPVSVVLLIVAIVTFVTITIFAWRGGRTYCNSVCPVGTILGFLSKFSWLKPVINTDKCTRCGSCARHCKASCIDSKNHKIDYSRCVACMDCLSECEYGAITVAPTAMGLRHTAPAPKSTDGGRRAFLTTGLTLAGVGLIHGAGADGGLAPLKEKKTPTRAFRLVPPGAKGVHHLSAHCIACQLCISNCPNEVLKPSTDLTSLMQPVMDFTNGYCRPECTKCSDVCPAGAIEPIDVATKSSTKIGTAVVDLKVCISAAYGQHCGSCSRHCPVGAITMIPNDRGEHNLRPLVDTEACIGCGSCEYHCPVGRGSTTPGEYAAIHVDGIANHRLI